MVNVPSAKRESERWSAHDIFVLRLLIGQQTYAQIAMHLGRAEGAVQRKASNLGLSSHAERADAKRSLAEARERERLSATEEDLAPYLVDLQDVS